MNESGYFAVIPGWLLSSPGISDGAKLFYGEVSRRCNERGYCWASNETLAADLRCGARTISRYVSELEDAGAIVTEKVGVSDRKRRIERRIRLAETCGFNLAKNGEVNVAKNGELNIAKNGESNNRLNNKSKNKPPIVPQGDKREEPKAICTWKPDRFLAFWEYYRDTFCAKDHSRAGERGEAAIAWDKLKPDDVTLIKLAAKLRAIMFTRQWKDGIGIKMASTFLNGVRLGKIGLDELPEPPAPSAQRSAPVTEEDAPL